MRMIPSRSRPALRRLALALAAAQIVAYAATPVVEALTERAPGPVSLEPIHTATCVILHSSDSCLACQLLSVHGQRACGTSLPAAPPLAAAPDLTTRTSRSLRAPPRHLRSRAPPAHLA